MIFFPYSPDNRFHRTKSANWTLDSQDDPGVFHHDIIGHRVVNLLKPNVSLESNEDPSVAKKNKAIEARRNKQRCVHNTQRRSPSSTLILDKSW